MLPYWYVRYLAFDLVDVIENLVRLRGIYHLAPVCLSFLERKLFLVCYQRITVVFRIQIRYANWIWILPKISMRIPEA